MHILYSKTTFFEKNQVKIGCQKTNLGLEFFITIRYIRYFIVISHENMQGFIPTLACLIRVNQKAS
jgi:hypothetical protein